MLTKIRKFTMLHNDPFHFALVFHRLRTGLSFALLFALVPTAATFDEKSTPAGVREAKRPTSKVSFHVFPNHDGVAGAGPATRPATHFTPRVIPHCSAMAVPLEAPRILWQR